MGARDLADELLSASTAGTSFDVPKIRQRIHAEFDKPVNETERELLLAIHKSVMDAFERQTRQEDLTALQKVRRQDYNLLLIKEAKIGDHPDDGHISPQKLAKITTREVAAGRMSPDDEFHKLAVAGATA